MTAYVERIEDGIVRVGQWINSLDGWRVVLLVGLAVVILPMAPVIAAVALFVGCVLLIRSWAREFLFLMRLSDDVFPARHDKLVWVGLMVGLPPVGYLLFRAIS